MINSSNIEKVTVPSILNRKGSHQKITALTAYDYTMASLIERSGVDIILVGDSLGSIIQGHSSTIPVTMDQMVYHCSCVSTAVKRAMVVGDMPFLSYQVSKEQAVENAGRLLKEGGVSAVKLEGGVKLAATIEQICAFDIPVMGHVGLTPQSIHRMGGHKVQGRHSGKQAGSRARILEDAVAVAEAGAFALVIEGVPQELACEITAKVSIPTIGIGAGGGCDGQILVTHDMLGMTPEFKPRFVKRYAEVGEVAIEAIKSYISEVQNGTFPSAQHVFSEDKGAKRFKLKVA